ncbi:MAG: NADH-ubiquinone oxidoreductase, partial [Acetobacteraceae bacterium]
LLRRLPFVPLPGGGGALVQPIHQDDVTHAIVTALDRAWNGPHSLVLAGPSPLPYADFVRAVARAAGLRPPRIVPLPVAPLIAAAPITGLLAFLPRLRAAEIRRLTEDKAFDTAPMRAELGLDPVALEQGLARTFGGPANP